MEKPWLAEKKEVPPEVLAIIKNARVNGCWIYRESAKEFYTPEEFESNWKNIVRDGKRNNFGDFKIVTPLFAVRLTAKWVDIANKKMQEVIEKLQGYEATFKKSNPRT